MTMTAVMVVVTVRVVVIMVVIVRVLVMAVVMAMPVLGFPTSLQHQSLHVAASRLKPARLSQHHRPRRAIA